MFTLLLGPNIFLKERKLSEIKIQLNLEVERSVLTKETFSRTDILGQDLFSKSKIYIFENSFKEEVKEFKIFFELCSNSKNYIYLLDQSSVKTSIFLNSVSKITGVKIENFSADGIETLRNFILKLVEEKKLKFSISAKKQLLEILAPEIQQKFVSKKTEEENILRFWKAENEIQKLSDFVNSKEISLDNIEEIITSEQPVDSFAISNAIAAKNLTLALQLNRKYLKQVSGTGNNQSMSLLVGLLAEQLGSLLTLNLFVSKNIPDKEILLQTGWKSGRLFVLKKISKNFTSKAIIRALEGLKNLDLEIKTSRMPPEVILDLVLTQLTV